ncbi:MAG: zinc ribbon domain-containing protein [Clostridia bacterium]|nr:zinc ribbon domain-containing protein [Clostridia bacterium]
MKCKNCGFENEYNAEFCTNCGESMKCNDMCEVEPVSLSPAADKALPAIKDKLFLVLCVLMTISCVLSLSGGMPLLNILFTIFLWLTYADAQKGFANEKHLQSISGTVYASYVITNVVSIMLIVCGVLVGLGMGMLAGTEEFATGFNEALSLYDFGEYSFSYDDIPQAIVEFAGIMIAVVFVIGAVIMLVINILGYKKIHTLAKSVYTGIMFQNPEFKEVRSAKNWLIFFGVCAAIGAVASIASQPVVALASGCEAAAAIIASVLIDKYLTEKPQYV